ncbi:MAG: hypothetical protein RIR62_382, partial [Pseudomonadota bacterium]
AAITLRSVAVAGTIILLWQPEALLEPGFQMSFAATIALVAGFEAFGRLVERRSLPRILPAVLAVLLSSLIGGLATAPYAAAHFNRFTDYGLVANLLTVSVMGAVVMPAGVVAAMLAPFGLAAPALWVMEQGARWILYVADRIAGLEGAVTGIPAPPAVVLPLVTLGALWLILWPLRERWAGVVPVMAALWLWQGAERPLLLVDPAARLAGLAGEGGRSLSRARGEGFTATNWLENDGDLSGQAQAAGRAGFLPDPLGTAFDLAGRRGLLLADGADAAAACARFDLVLAGAEVGAVDGPCRLIGPAVLARSGTLAFHRDGDRIRIAATRDARRAWSMPEAGPEAGPALDLADLRPLQ